MYDIERINKIVKDIEEYFLRLQKLGLNKDNIEIDEKFFSASMIIFTILNRMIDLAGEIIVKNAWGTPNTYEQYFEVLGKNGIIDKKLAEGLRKLVKDRNLFAHEYYEMQRKEVLRVSKDVYAVKDFVERIKKVVAKGCRK